MIKTVELINKWAQFRENHPEGEIEDFCRYYLMSGPKKDNPENFLGGLVPPEPMIILIKLLSRISRLFVIYGESALEGTGVKKFDEFLFLNTIYFMNEPRKTEVIYHLMTELSTGLNIIASLREEGLITELDDPEDKRSKRLKVTARGKKTLDACHQRTRQVCNMFFGDMSSDDILLCIQLLKNVESKMSDMHKQQKGKLPDQFSKM